MVQLQHKYDCCGCNACVQKCPKHCISMSEDDEGFLYPKIDVTKCINCHLCEKVCPTINQFEPRSPKGYYAAYNPDENVRKDSSSGGVFSLMAEKIVSEGGMVFGASWNEKWQVAHTYAEKKDDLAAFRGSKYIQSIIGESYYQTERYLKEGRKVLFSGTPCQIAGLRLYLNKEYDNLLTVDFICHGVPSPGVFRTYLQEDLFRRIENKNICVPFVPDKGILLPSNTELKTIHFRDKCSGWKKFSFKYSFLHKGKETVVTEDLETNSFLKGFLSDLYLRPSCHKCPVKEFKSGADITIADYWGYVNTPDLTDDDKGISAVFVNTDKGYREYSNLKLTSFITTYEKIKRINGAIEHSASFPYREFFFYHKKTSFSRIVDKITSKRFIDKVSRKLFLLTHKPELQ